ncbi:MarR family winged helix-turn-helix transcriptional regulator [Glycomyces sp. YM15]|uniref:MarR family winged helix-turn-helix transcriptional regulator n=1 Tax=Glycomyces sp. YM15 TaxID=2800446 RepID=UPI0019632432|nr:MarR family transcriptional regulator [Glycomyces sp. YM15]
MPDKRTLAQTEAAMSAHVGHLPIDFRAAHALSSLYRAANAARTHLTNSVLREHDLSWTGFVVLWVIWIEDGLETREAAEAAAISKATLTGVVKTLAARGWIRRIPSTVDRRLVNLELTQSGKDLMEDLFPKFNAGEAELVAGLSQRRIDEMTKALRQIVKTVESS